MQYGILLLLFAGGKTKLIKAQSKRRIVDVSDNANDISTREKEMPETIGGCAEWQNERRMSEWARGIGRAQSR